MVDQDIQRSLEEDSHRKQRHRFQERMATLASLSSWDIAALLRELHLYCGDLEVQNDQLRAAQRVLVDSCNRCAERYDSAPVGYVTLDHQGIILDINMRATRMLQAEASPLEGHPFSPCVAADDRSRFLQHLGECRAGASEVTSELRLVGRQGKTTAVQLRSIPLRPSGAKSSYHTAMIDITNITELKRSEEAIREGNALREVAKAVEAERQRLFDMLETLPIMICLMTPDRHVAFTNRAYRQRFGEPKGRRCYEYCCGRDTPCECCESYRPLETGQPHHWEYTSPDGQTVMDAYDFPFTDVDGSPMVLEMDIDIAERRRAEEALQRSEQRLALATSGTHIGMFEWNIATGGSLWNEQHARLLGLETTAATVTTTLSLPYDYADWAARVHPDDLPRVEAELRRCATEHVPYESEYRVLWPNGSQHWVSTRGVYHYDAQGQPHRMLGILMDITERKEAEEQLQALNETLEHRVRQRTAEVLWRTNQLQQLAAEMAEAEERERRRLAQILHDHLQQVLVAAKIKLGLAKRRALEEQASDAIAEAFTLVDEAIAESRSLTKELSPPVLYDGGLAAAIEWLARETEGKHHLPVMVQVDPEIDPDDLTTKVFVYQAVRELILNTVKHAQASSLRICASRIEEDRLQVVVEDDGSGFNPELINRGSSEGGFGLFSIQERLDVIGGQLDITSVRGQGTKATILAPFQRTPREAGPSHAVNEHRWPRPEPPHGPTERIRVLLADDHTVLRKGLADLLGEHPDFHLVGEARDGREAVELALQLRPDVLLMDITMPGMDGIEATRQIKQVAPEISVIGLSMHESKEMIAAITSAGASNYLTKSAPVEDLVSAILQGRPRTD